MDKLQWFKFNPTDWIMGKIQRCPDITQARFMRLICVYWNKGCVLSVDDSEVEIDKEHLDILISKKVLKQEKGFIKIDFLDEQIDKINDISQKARESAKARWEKKAKKEPKKELLPTVQETKQTEILDFDKLLKYINTQFNRDFKKVNDAVKKKFKARLKDGYTNLDIKNCIDNLAAVPYHKENGYQYCTPEFISRSETLEKYSSKTVIKKEPQTSLTLGKHDTG